jgi:hypothetical protein
MRILISLQTVSESVNQCLCGRLRPHSLFPLPINKYSSISSKKSLPASNRQQRQQGMTTTTTMMMNEADGDDPIAENQESRVI